MAGAALARDAGLIRQLRRQRNMFGNILQPDECWLLEIRAVMYPTLFQEPEQQRIYRAQCDYPGSMFTTDFRGGRPAAFLADFEQALGRSPVKCRTACHVVC